MPSSSPAKPRSHDTTVRAVQDQHHCYSLPPRARPRGNDATLSSVRDRRFSSLPLLANPRPHDTVQDSHSGSAMADAARIGKPMATSAALRPAEFQRTPDRWKRYPPPPVPLPPPPRPASRWGNLESLLAVLLLTVLLLLLPLMLPELPPPPVALLLIPLAIMAASLIVLAFLPSDFRTAASSYV